MATHEAPAASHGDRSAAPARLAAVREAMGAEFSREHADPWIVAHSGGKDSTLLLQFAWEVATDSVGHSPCMRPADDCSTWSRASRLQI